jgi:hypothetical protein
MTTLRLVILAVAFLIGGWLGFDGSRALIVGDYVSSRSGPWAGQEKIVNAESLNSGMSKH